MKKERKYYGHCYRWKYGIKKFTNELADQLKKKKIAVIENGLFSTYTMREGLMQRLLREGYDVTILTHTNSFVPQVEKMGLNVINIGSGNLNPFKVLKYIYQFIQCFKEN